ncbi:MAG TPA: cobalamin-dependent protein [Frankiaceae bacterium]|nr:cobalamin-dependent protein [Frankiaceae bacterium]
MSQRSPAEVCHASYDVYCRAVAAGDAAAAVAAAGAAVSAGVPPRRVVAEVVARAQRAVAADETTASVTERALTVLAPPSALRAGVPAVVLACAEGERHTLAARLAGALARDGRYDVVTVGGSLPAHALRRHLRATRPVALALSCTSTAHLLAAARGIAAAHDEGVPVVVGGAAWGSGERRAVRLGADAWLADPAGLSAVVDRLTYAAPRPAAYVRSEVWWLDAVSPAVLASALPGGDDRALDDLRSLARHAAAAVACDDAGVLDEWLRWLLPQRAGRDARALLDGCAALGRAVAAEAPHGADLLRAAAGRAVAVPAPRAAPVTARETVR